MAQSFPSKRLCFSDLCCRHDRRQSRIRIRCCTYAKVAVETSTRRIPKGKDWRPLEKTPCQVRPARGRACTPVLRTCNRTICVGPRVFQGCFVGLWGTRLAWPLKSHLIVVTIAVHPTWPPVVGPTAVASQELAAKATLTAI